MEPAETGAAKGVNMNNLLKVSTGLLITSTLLLAACGSGGGGDGSGDDNGGPGVDQAAAPAFDPAGGLYSSDIEVEITTSTTGASIYWTDDGSEPDTSSNLYIDPISISGDGTQETLKAMAVKSGMTDSETATAEFTIDYSLSYARFDEDEFDGSSPFGP
jgi:hypothetical protein